MSDVLISDLLEPCFFFDCVLVIVSLVTLNGSQSPSAIQMLKSLRLQSNRDVHF